jgi:3-oxoacyl-[acyl-carrier protein] reductase
MKNFQNIKGKRVLVTGASSGIGAATAKLFASNGARVGLHYCENKAGVEKIAKEITISGGEVEIFQANLISSKERTKLADDFLKAFKGIDILINNAGGIVGSKHFNELDENSWDETFELNVKAAFFLTQKAFEPMQKQKSSISVRLRLSMAGLNSRFITVLRKPHLKHSHEALRVLEPNRIFL